MNSKILIAIVAIIAIAAGAYYFLTMNPTAGGTVATSTDSTAIGDTSGTSDTGDTTSDSTPAAAPTITTDAKVFATNSTAVVTGTVTPDGAPTTYWYEYGTTQDLGKSTASQVIGSSFSSIAAPAYITGLNANTSYYFRLSARNSYGTVHGATYGFSTNNNPPAAGAAPAVSSNTAQNVTRASATLRASVNPRSSATTFWFEYGTSADFGHITAIQSAGSENTVVAVSAPVSGLQPQTKYYFRVNAQNQYGTVNSATQTFTTQGPAADAHVPVVTTQVAISLAANSATLRGTVNAYGTQTTYWFEYSTDSTLASAGLKTTGKKSDNGTLTDAVTANINGLKSGTTYYYRIVAQNGADTVRGDLLSFQTK